MRLTNESKKVIDLAEKIPIEMVLEDLFNIDSPSASGAWKTHCPLGAEHSDGGSSKALKVFSESNSAWCFSHYQKFTPISLWRLRHRSSKIEAAYAVLKHFGQEYRPLTPAERWDRLNNLPAPVLELDDLRNAIMMYCRAHLPGFDYRQYDPDFMKVMVQVLDSLSDLPDHASYDMIQSQLDECKNKLKNYWRNNGWY